MINHIFIHEQDYLQKMENTVLPFLQGRKETKTLTVQPNQKIYCDCYTADNARGVIIISHGFTENAEKYKEMIYYFLNWGYHVYIPEHCGHGRSFRLTDDPSLVHIDRWQHYVRDLIHISKVAARRHPGLKMYIYGHSMGGAIGAEAAAHTKDLFCRAILSSPMIAPATGSLPFSLAALAAKLLCFTGHGSDYVPIHHPFDGKERFEDSASTSRVRFDYYQPIRRNNPQFWTNAASCRWLWEACRMSSDLLHKSCKKLQIPVLLFQSGNDTCVDNRAQNIFAERTADCRIKAFPNARHELYSTPDETFKEYLKTMFNFLQE